MLKRIKHLLNQVINAQTEQQNHRSWIPKRPLSSSAKSCVTQDDMTQSPFSLQNGMIAPSIDPRLLFPMLRRLRDYIPDVSAGVWAWVRLCCTPQSYSISHCCEAEQPQVRKILEQLDSRVCGCQPGREYGVEALVQMFFTSVFTYGSFAGEVLLDDTRKQIQRFVVIDPATIRFRYGQKEQMYLPYQIQAHGDLVALNPASFFYFGLDTDGLSPYGRSPLLSLPLVVKLQQQLLYDMAKAQHNAGYPTIHFKVSTPERSPGETIQDYNARLNNQLDLAHEEINNRKPESNLITYDSVDVEYIGPTGNRHNWSESMQAISEQVISGLHLAPFMIGRNWGTTQTWGTAQYQLLTNNARNVQQGAKRLAEWLRNLELALHGSTAQVSHHFAPHHHIDVLDRAKAFQTNSQTLMELSEKGLIEPSQAKNQIEQYLQFG